MTFSVTAPTTEHLRTFRDDLWKEQRVLELVRNHQGVTSLRKHFRDRSQVDAELRYLRVGSDLGGNFVPDVIDNADTYIDLAYIEGTRVHNVLNLLREIEPEDNRARLLRMRLIERCARSCSLLQDALVQDMVKAPRYEGYYPLREKITSLLYLFSHCLRFDLNVAEIETEVQRADEYLKGVTCPVPFRDATPKNLILAWPDMWLGRTSSDKQREIIREMVRCWSSADSCQIDSIPIVQIDFSACRELTVPEDDPISLLVHESTWLGSMPSVDHLLWQPVQVDRSRLAIGMLIRMLRYGGRRLSYRLVHSSGYRARYGDESIKFYFDALRDAANTVCPDLATKFTGIMSVTRIILDRLALGLSTQRDWFDLQYGPQPERYYRDVYPF